MWNYAMFLPATVRADGRGESVGEVQAVVNFELLISSATNRLMNDASHVALDPHRGLDHAHPAVAAGRACTRRWRGSRIAIGASCRATSRPASPRDAVAPRGRGGVRTRDRLAPRSPSAGVEEIAWIR